MIGGGLTGLWTARALQERGVSASSSKRQTCGAGASARNGGFLHGYWSSLRRLNDALGAEGALETARAADGAIRAVRAARRRRLARGRRAALRLCGAGSGRARPPRDRALRPSSACPTRRSGRSRRTGSGRRRSAPPCYYRDGATVHPARLVRALRRGVRVYERTPALGLEAGLVRTPGGAVRAGEIVLATNAWAARWPAERYLAVLRSAIVLTAPVPDLAERVGWEGGEGVFDGRTFLSYFRTTRDGRVLMGSAGRLGRAGGVGAAHACCRRSPTCRSSTRGRGRSTSRATGCRSSPPFPARGSTTGPAIPGTGSVRAGSAGRSSPPLRPGRTTAGRTSRLRRACSSEASA